LDENEIAREIVGAAFHIHRSLGPGLLESVYETLLFDELRKRRLWVERQVPISFTYNGRTYDKGFRIDLLADGKVVVELKAVEQTADVHKRQLFTYLKLANQRLGLLINFGYALFKSGVTQIENGLPE
jgi:GxxExxY protein